MFTGKHSHMEKRPYDPLDPNISPMARANPHLLDRLRGTQREYELLFYSMSGARIFFKEGKSSKEKAAAKHAEEEEARAAAAAHEDATVLPSANAGGGGLALPSF